MTAEQFRQERLYQATMSIVKSMRDKGLITETEYIVIRKLMLEKYHPPLGRLMDEGSRT